jgi:DNA-binding MarR family transcriptional regulator
MAVNIYSGSVRAVFELMESSTADRYYRTQLIEVTGYTGPTIDKATGALCKAGFVRREQECTYEDTNRAPRIYYSLTPKGLYTVRLQDSST